MGFVRRNGVKGGILWGLRLHAVGMRLRSAPTMDLTAAVLCLPSAQEAKAEAMMGAWNVEMQGEPCVTTSIGGSRPEQEADLSPWRWSSYRALCLLADVFGWFHYRFRRGRPSD